jgi:benzoylformate decarboxylase
MTILFGHPGSTKLPFLDSWRDGFCYIPGLQETSVGAMADGLARTSAAAAFCDLPSAVGAGHTFGDLFAAFRNGTPLVITAGQQARGLLCWNPAELTRLGAKD